MKKIITALDNQIINQNLRELDNYQVLGTDISYQDGIFEILEKENADILLLSEILPGKLNIKELILKIKNVRPKLDIIIFLEKENKELERFLKGNDIYNIFYNNKITINELIKNIEDKKQNNNTEEIINFINNENEKACKVISIIGPSGSGKTFFATAIAKRLGEEEKILVLDFDLLNEDINLLLKKNININIISGQDLLFKNKNNESEKIENMIDEYKKDYSLIIINTSSECFFKINRRLIKKSDKCIFISGTNLVEIKKSETLLNIYSLEWGIEKEKINIILNKYNTFSIDEKIIFKLFKKYKVIGKIKFTNNNKMIINSKLLQNLGI